MTIGNHGGSRRANAVENMRRRAQQHTAPLALGVHLSLMKRSILAMLWTIAVILFVLWALGLVTSYTLGGFIHLLLVLALVVIVIQVIQGRRVV
jgi:CBS domain containing-hemolysin-like protein